MDMNKCSGLNVSARDMFTSHTCRVVKRA
jgi:hypothetical protein